MSNPPTFVWPAFSAARWAFAWLVAMLETAGQGHHTWKWLFLLGFAFHAYRALWRLGQFVGRRVWLAAGQHPPPYLWNDRAPGLPSLRWPSPRLRPSP